MRTLASSVLVAEAFVLFFATLVAKDLSTVDEVDPLGGRRGRCGRRAWS